MEIINIKVDEPIDVIGCSVACIGYFDGVHKGHQALIDKTLELAGNDYIPSVICFNNDPHVVMHKVVAPRYITPFQKRLEILEEKGIRRCFLLHFDETMMHFSKEKFVSDILNHLHLKALVCGEDFRFAYQGTGSVETLMDRTFLLHVISEKSYKGKKISSSAIEALIEKGHMKQCYELLGHDYSIKGTVIHGANVGASLLGFPTANLQMDENYLIPKKGVYFGYVEIDMQKYKAMINVGNNPTMNYQMNTSIEAHIIDFNDDIYDREIVFYFHDYIRDEMKFECSEGLIQQLKYDIQFVRNL